MLNLPPLSLYLHIPWCVKKCYYCDFNSHVQKNEVPYQEYINHLLMDLNHDISLISDRTINTLFIGGGTPSLFSANLIKLLLDGIRQRVPLAPDAEITIEANPSTIDVDHFAGYKLAGINRISIGIQSFSAEKLVHLGRIHSAKEARRAVQLTASLGLCSFNIDLMQGLPDQSITDSLSDLSEAIALSPPHLSWYQLTIEKNTLFESRPPVLPDDDILWEIYQHGDILLKASGYHQYEISSYSRIGFECRHNLNYWRFGDYLGIGCGAHGKLTQPNGIILRTIKAHHPRNYMQSNYLIKSYPVVPAELPFEYFMNRFRLLEAVPRAEFSAFTGLKENTVRLALDHALASNYITESINHWQVTQKGKLFLNTLLELFV
ncbi:Oxygen-independent coproporphyrinogen-III oxidase 1 [Candidatus Gullanella endobia]|uniref:Heme chaperone HemW n=1 Tax=Candidatus Gullanella endobia TaxID=1070130 RepID=A0A143WR27_9ENTR|nr:radical SAM family heme chaperone HemW [Candidatus Gullanella endobia]CUX96182.1 Oxygen-independent coproporphyrinogen-III oxidase 1 [Candidatus Gullanella endobia]